MKAGAQCVYSPPGTSSVTNSGSRRPVDVSRADNVVENERVPEVVAAAGCGDWTAVPYDFDFASLLPTMSVDGAQPCPGNTPDDILGTLDELDTTSKEPPSEGSSDARLACVKELTTLLLDCDEVRARMPLHADLHISWSEAGDAFLEGLSAKMATRHILEKLFVLAQRLIDLYPTAISTCLATDLTIKSTCEVSDCIHEIDLILGLKEVEEGVLQQGTLFGPDVALANLLVACHARQLDILDRILLLVTSCTRVTLANQREPDFDVSEMRVGSFVPQRTAAVLMQVALLKHLVASLTDRLASFGEALLEWTKTRANVDLEVNILKLQHESLTRRQATKATQVGLVEDFLLKFDFHRE